MGRMNGVLAWYKENTDSNPNIYELMEVMGEASRLEEIDPEVVTELADLEIKRLKDKGIVDDENDQLVVLINELRAKVLNGEKVSENAETLYKNTAGVAFFIRNEEKNTGKEFAYNNFEEYYLIRGTSKIVSRIEGPLSEAMKGNLEFIESRYKGYRREEVHVTVEDEKRKKEREEKRYNDAEQKAKLIAEQVDGFVYPEKLLGLINYIKRFNLNMSADVLAKAIISLGTGENFKNVTEELDKKIGWGSTRILVINALAKFAKNGPDFWLSDKKSRGEKIDNDDLKRLDEFRKENIELEAKHNQQAPQVPGL